MSDAINEKTGLATMAGNRLWASRYVIVAAAVVLLIASLLGGVAGWAAFGILAVLSIAIAFFSGDGGFLRAATEKAAASPALHGLSPLHLTDAMPDPIVIFDRGGSVVHANAAAKDAFGQLEGLPVRLKFRTPEMQDLVSRIVDAGADGEVVEFAERVPIERLFGVSGVAIGDGSGLFVLVFKDQSEGRRIDRMRADFIANASHELRTPLASIAGFIETLKGPARNDAKARDNFLRIMEAQTSRMARLIDDLLSLSRLEMKTRHRAGDMVDLAAVLAAVVDTLKPLADELSVVIEKDMPAGPVPVKGDRDELFQVFENLVENACKYGQSGKRVVVSAGKAVNGATASVRDFGPGIPKEHVPRVTERFYRVDVENSRAQKGTGLGLAIVKHILTRHEARLEIWSEPGKGALFSVHFPPVRTSAAVDREEV